MFKKIKELFLAGLLASSGCGALVPDVITIEDELDNGLQQLLELGIREEACSKIEKEGYDCNIPEQIHSIRFEWHHDPDNTVSYRLKFCLKENCPLEKN